MSDLPLDQVRTLLAVVDEQSFDRAAAVLHVTPPAVSQRVKALEQRVGRVLVLRTKPVRLTESGQVLVRFARQLTRLESDTRAELGLGGPERDGPAATVAIAVNADSLATWFLGALEDVPADPPVSFDLRSDDQDHTAALLREGQVMAAVTSAPHPVQGCSVTRLGTMRYRAVAAPAFAARWIDGGPLAQRLPAAPAVLFDRKDDLQDRFLRRLTRRRRPEPVRHYIPASVSFVDAVAAGLGWGMVPELQLAGRGLTDLAPDRPTDVPLYWQQWKLDSPPLAGLAAAVARAAARALAR
ncbi:LysR family transcriptional regulator ArgP [Amycolatopsis jiangsuensis]|uniref:HTH-type transcriptional regulator LysG n=1 Tax=Amycolatopsis jiangsuensis TaxID=1181879 RepID=A0A840IPB1_9PSEU|nr:LysR family transcriptional regulator ArgP [Amycolatopsis jiangsuensis]MBB4684311.1 LysR family transcriptional regulator (chromosome initiation inhibitor) [Amycolatopsis jiangsuensis]